MEESIFSVGSCADLSSVSLFDSFFGKDFGQ